MFYKIYSCKLAIGYILNTNCQVAVSGPKYIEHKPPRLHRHWPPPLLVVVGGSAQCEISLHVQKAVSRRGLPLKY